MDGLPLEKSMPLPSDLFNDPDEVLSVGSGDETPPAPDPSELLADMCCRYCCLKNENVMAMQKAWQDVGRSTDESRSKMFQQMVEYARQRDPASRKRQYSYFGCMVCRDAWRTLWGVGESTVDAMRTHAIEVHLLPPPDMRSARTVRPKGTKYSVATQFWIWAYYNVAEPFAEDVEGSTEPSSIKGPFSKSAEGEQDDSEPPWKDSETGLSASKSILQPKHVPRRIQPLSWEEVYLLFDHWLQNGPGVDIENDDLCSHQTVKRCYKAEWKAALPFRRESTHAVCDTCQWFKEWRKKDAAGSTEAKN